MEVGKSIEVYVYRSGYKYRLVSKLEDVKEDNFSITLITSRTKTFHFEDTDKIEIIYRKNHQLWKWKDLKASMVVLDNDVLHRFLAIGSLEGEKFNRRNAFRVFLGEKVTLTYYEIHLESKKDKASKEEDTSITEEIDYKEKHCYGLIKDLSESGVGIFTNHEFDKKDEVKFTLDTPYGMLKCNAVIVRKIREKNGLYGYFYGCMFTATNNNLVKYIYTLQRKRLSGNDR